MTQTTDLIRKFLDSVDAGEKEILDVNWHNVLEEAQPVGGFVNMKPTKVNKIVITYEVKDE